MEKFTTEDPDGNGKDDTYGANLLPSSANWIGILGIRERFGYPGAGCYYDSNGVIQYPFAHENYRTYVETFAKMYQNGWIDPEWATNDWDTWVEKMNNSNSGYTGIAYVQAVGDWAATRPPQSVVTASGGEVVVLPMPTYRTSYYSDTIFLLAGVLLLTAIPLGYHAREKIENQFSMQDQTQLRIASGRISAFFSNTQAMCQYIKTDPTLSEKLLTLQTSSNLYDRVLAADAIRKYLSSFLNNYDAIEFMLIKTDEHLFRGGYALISHPPHRRSLLHFRRNSPPSSEKRHSLPCADTRRLR